LAHGRVSGDELGNMHVIKYSRSRNGKVKVEYKKKITQADIGQITDRMSWFSMEISKRMGAKMPDDYVPDKYN